MRVGVITFPGSNCDADCLHAVRLLGHEGVPIWHAEKNLPPVEALILPGGFSYGDYLRSGAMAARSPVMREVVKRANEGVFVLGVCNGFQIVTETGLLPGALMRNRDLKFLCQDVHLKVDNNTTPFSSFYEKGQVIRVPIAHHDGNYFATEDEIKALEDNDQIVFRYCDADGNLTTEANVNGSQNSIAGIINKKGNVMGMMPHPERLIEAALGGNDGRALFESILQKFPIAA